MNAQQLGLKLLKLPKDYEVVFRGADREYILVTDLQEHYIAQTVIDTYGGIPVKTAKQKEKKLAKSFIELI